MTREGGDRVAGGHPVIAAAFLPTQAHVLCQCNWASLDQVVGRLKSRLATLLLFEPHWSENDKRIWGRGFWTARILDYRLIDLAKRFIEGLEVIRPLDEL
jgi:hypothetical protein